MYFQEKNTFKNNFYHNFKHAISYFISFIIACLKMTKKKKLIIHNIGARRMVKSIKNIFKNNFYYNLKHILSSFFYHYLFKKNKIKLITHKIYGELG
jgi:hypothetical protein